MNERVCSVCGEMRSDEYKFACVCQSPSLRWSMNSLGINLAHAALEEMRVRAATDRLWRHLLVMMSYAHEWPDAKRGQA